MSGRCSSGSKLASSPVSGWRVSNLRTTTAVTTVIAVAIAIGAWQFPRALEPRPGTTGVTLNDVVDVSSGAVANDWFRGTGRIAAGGGAIRLAAPAAPADALEL